MSKGTMTKGQFPYSMTDPVKWVFPNEYEKDVVWYTHRSNKDYPVVTGVLDYFPDAIKEVARCSKVGNDQHNPGEPLHWAREKSSDHADCIVRHLIEREKFDTDGIRHSAKVAWRALAMLQLEIETCKPSLKS